MRANLHLRAASRVLVRVARFKATAFYELESRAKNIGWTPFVPAAGAVEFRVTAKKSRLYHSDAIAERLQKAVSRELASVPKRSARVRSPQLPPRSAQLFVVRVLHDEFVISADTSGELLHMRGYRQAVGKAPLRETLAAALLLAAEWRGQNALLDPFCGSGTIPIEAALIARRIPPGLRRAFAFMDWCDFDESAWSTLVREARARVLASSPVPIAGSDRDAGAVEQSRANAERAGVAADIVFAPRPISDVEAITASGLLATNPPYGVRVGELKLLRNLYARFGQVIRERFHEWEVALFSGESRLTRELAMDARELFRTTNGGIKVIAVQGKAAN